MTNRSRTKGTSAETAVVDFYRANGHPHAERRAFHGAQDRGDVAGIVGVVTEVKNCDRLALAEWVDEALTEQGNDRADLAVVFHKRRGRTNPADWYVTMTGAQWAHILNQLGYGNG